MNMTSHIDALNAALESSVELYYAADAAKSLVNSMLNMRMFEMQGDTEHHDMQNLLRLCHIELAKFDVLHEKIESLLCSVKNDIGSQPETVDPDLAALVDLVAEQMPSRNWGAELAKKASALLNQAATDPNCLEAVKALKALAVVRGVSLELVVQDGRLGFACQEPLEHRLAS